MDVNKIIINVKNVRILNKVLIKSGRPKNKIKLSTDFPIQVNLLTKEQANRFNFPNQWSFTEQVQEYIPIISIDYKKYLKQ